MSRISRKASALTHRNLPLLMLQGREQLMIHFRPVLKAQGITEQQWRIVRVLLDSGPLEPHVIGARCCLSSPSLVGVLRRMEQLRLVTRKRVAHDQRRVQVALTPRSRGLAARMTPQIENTYRLVGGLLGGELSDSLCKMLEAVIEKVSAGGLGRESDPSAKKNHANPQQQRQRTR